MDETLQAIAVDWLEVVGQPATYRSTRTGLVAEIRAVLEKDVSTFDEQGMTADNLVVSVLSSEVEPSRGDTLRMINTEERLKVEQLLDDPGQLTRLLVSRQ